MLPFKSPASRLVRLFKKGRDNWRDKALERQQEIRGLEIKVRDLSESRENWKKRAIEAELQLKQLLRGGNTQEKKEEIKTSEANGEVNIESEQLNALGHHYNIKTIRQSLELIIDCGISFRGIEKVFESFKDLLPANNSKL